MKHSAFIVTAECEAMFDMYLTSAPISGYSKLLSITETERTHCLPGCTLPVWY